MAIWLPAAMKRWTCDRRRGGRDGQAVGADRRAVAGRQARRRGASWAGRSGVVPAGVVRRWRRVPRGAPTSSRSGSTSPASTTPSTRRWAVRSQRRTAACVPRRTAPSTLTRRTPALRRKPWRTLTSWPLMPMRTGRRSPRVLLRVRALTSEKPPLFAEAARPALRVVAERRRSVAASAVPVPLRPVTPWKARTAFVVSEPYSPSAATAKPALRQQALQPLDRRPGRPGASVVARARRVLEAADAAGAATSATGAASAQADNKGTTERVNVKTAEPPLWAPTGLAVGLARRRPRYAGFRPATRPRPPKWSLGPPLPERWGRPGLGWSQRPRERSAC